MNLTVMENLTDQAELVYPSSSQTVILWGPALGGVASIEPTPAQLLIEPLTSRELEVLKLIEVGCTNQDIADRLVISIPTVKRHISISIPSWERKAGRRRFP